MLSFASGYVCVHECDLYACMCVHLCVCVSISVRIPQHTYGGQRTICNANSHFPPLDRVSCSTRLPSLSCYKSDSIIQAITHACYCEQLLRGSWDLYSGPQACWKRSFSTKPPLQLRLNVKINEHTQLICMQICFLSLIVKLYGYKRIVLRWIYDSFSANVWFAYLFYILTYVQSHKNFLSRKVSGVEWV